LVGKERGLAGVVEVYASPYKLTLILSFVLSNLLSKIRDCKLKTCIVHCF